MPRQTTPDEETPTPSPPPSMAGTPHRLAVRNKNGDGNGRKRVSDVGGEPSASRRRTREPSPPNNAEQQDLEAYDPDQSMEERRAIQRKFRNMQKEMRENPDQFLQADPTPMLKFLHDSNKVMENVKQTNEATIDSRGLVIASDLAARRVQRLTSGNVGNGIDVDEFVSKCITFMRHGGGIQDDEAEELSMTQRRRRQPNRGAIGSDDEDDDEGDSLNWAHLGRFACVPSVRRPAVPGFLLGPLSIEKKIRKVTKRSAPFKINSLIEVRPQELRAEDLKKSDKNDLPSICKKIYDQLRDHQRDAQDELERIFDAGDYSIEEQREIIGKFALSTSEFPTTSGMVDLVKFVVNPHSFGQTVENMFYISFLIREGSVELAFDEHNLPFIRTPLYPPSDFYCFDVMVSS
ncbi:Non-structural maintenance of chromosomes element 4 A [Naviculisporaceae sp. PSN 640]